MHELHLRGPGLDGTLIDLYQFVYVVDSEQDYDGDKIPNELEPCGFYWASGIDADDDGVDDACDATIGAPTPPKEEPVIEEEDLSYKTEGSSPETNPPYDNNESDINAEESSSVVSTSTVVAQSTQPSRATESSNNFQQAIANSSEVLSANENQITTSTIAQIDDDFTKATPTKNENQVRNRWIVPALLFGFTMVMVISYSIYRHGKKEKV
jgi:hypothetical protein